ncbi:MAG: protein kinase [bacterium]
MNLSDSDIFNLEQTTGLFQKRLQCAVCSAFIAIPDAHLANQSVISGYRIGPRIEVDGAREIYEAEHIQKRQKVSVQVFHSPELKSGEPARLFLNAMRHYMQIKHPHLVSIMDAGQFSEGTFFAAWQSDVSMSLEHRLWNGGAIELKPALHLATLIGKVQEWLWTEHGLIYGILSPRRIRIAPNNSVRLFNTILTPLVRNEPPTFPLDTLGMPGFMSPEMLTRTNSLDCRSDIYTLGATMYTMLTGTAPFSGLNSQQIQESQASASLPDPRTLNPDIPAAVVELLKSTLAHDPNDRPQDWPTFLHQLETLTSDQPVPAPAPMKHHSVLIQLPPEQVPSPMKKKVLVRPNRIPIMTVSQPAAPPSKPDSNPSRAFYGILAGGLIAVIVLIGWLALTAPPPPPPKSAAHSPTNAAAIAGAISLPALTNALASTTTPMNRPPDSSFEALYKAAQEHLKTHPTDYDGMLERYKVLLAMTETLRPNWHFQILEERRNIEMLKSFALNRAIEEIRQKATEYSNMAGYTEGIAWLNGYQGLFTNETSELRGRLSSNLILLAQTQTTTARAKAQINQTALNEAQTVQRKAFLADLSKTILSGGGLEQARPLILNWNHPHDLGWPKAQQDELLKQVELLSKLHEKVLECYKALIGKTIELQLLSETMSGKLTGVENQQITLQTLASDGGTITLPVPLDKIRMQDVLHRLAGAPPSERLLLQGFYAWQHNDEKLALASFSGMTNSLLASALATHIGQLVGQTREAEAQTALDALVALTGIAPSKEDPKSIATQIDQIAFTDSQCIKIKEAAQHFTKLYGTTTTAQNAMPILVAVKAASAITRKTDLATLKNMIEPLRAWRSGDKPLLFSYRIDEDLIYLDLSENKSLPSLLSLKSLPFKELSLRKCGITKLPPLEGFHISRLDLSESDITNLSGISGAFIDELIISGTQVTSLRALKSLSLHVFIAENCPNLSDLTGLATTNLTRIVLTGSTIPDLSSLEGAPLISADFSKCTLLNDLKSLAQCPLEELTLAGCSRISMVYALKGLPLKKLDISSTSVSDLTPLTYLPLETLNLANARNVMDLSPLVNNTHLRNLTLPGKSANASCLRQHKALEAIGYPDPISSDLYWRRNP